MKPPFHKWGAQLLGFGTENLCPSEVIGALRAHAHKQAFALLCLSLERANRTSDAATSQLLL